MKECMNENEKEICFIICSNDALYTEECIYYIMHLRIPEGYTVNVLTVENADSMTVGYNEGMSASSAKYKVYLHQDTFVVNPDFIQDFLDIFRQDEQIGMIGMVGTSGLPASGVMWESKRCGGLYSWNIFETVKCVFNNSALAEVEVVDGFCMITQYDIPWREDLFDKWDFYDCSQSKEFARHGYKVVVPRMEEPWCLHNSGFVNIENYEKERRKFVEEYKDEIPAVKEMEIKRALYKATVILVSHNQKELLQNTLEWLESVEGIANIIIVDNASNDMTAQWLATQHYEYVWFDEGVQGFGKLWNTVLDNFAVQDYIVFLHVGVYPERNSLIKLMEMLEKENAGIASPISNTYPYYNDEFKGKERLSIIQGRSYSLIEGMQYAKGLAVNWKMWAAARSLFEKNGFFHDELKMPDSVLTDYTLRMIQNKLPQIVCYQAYAYDDYADCKEIYAEGEQWHTQDRNMLKNLWAGMNYFNLKPNRSLTQCINEEAGKKFKVLEIGCDLGATLLEIQNLYPDCKTYGLEINETAVSIARNFADVRCGNIEELKVPFEEKFDYIIFGDVLEHLRQPDKVIEMCRDILMENGYIIASIPNIMHISVLEELISGRFTYTDSGLLDRTHIHFFTFYEILHMFDNAGYIVDDIGKTNTGISEEQRKLQDILVRLSDATEEWMFETVQYIVKARKKKVKKG